MQVFTSSLKGVLIRDFLLAWHHKIHLAIDSLTKVRRSPLPSSQLGKKHFQPTQMNKKAHIQQHAQ
jgi:hypothetical protein